MILSADFARVTADQALLREVKRDDLYTLDVLIRERAAGGWYTLTVVPFSRDEQRTTTVAAQLRKLGYVVDIHESGRGLHISWYGS